MPNFNITHRDHRGNTKNVIDKLLYLSYSLPTRKYGVATLRLPVSYDFTLIKDYDRIRIERDGVIEGDTDWFITRYGYKEQSGTEFIEITAFSALYLIDGPIARYYAGHSKALIENEEADDLIKRIVRENMGVDTDDSARQLPSDLFEVEAPTLYTASDSKGFSNRRIATVIKQVAEKNGIYYDVVLKNVADNTLIFKVFYPYRGVDKSDILTFSKAAKNLQNPSIIYDYSSEFVIYYAGGQGENVNRVIQSDTNVDRRDHPWARVREGFTSVNSKTATIVKAEAEARQAVTVPKIIVSGNLKDTVATQYGRDWRRGDVVSVSHKSIVVPVIINYITNTYDNNREIINASIEGVSV